MAVNLNNLNSAQLGDSLRSLIVNNNPNKSLKASELNLQKIGDPQDLKPQMIDPNYVHQTLGNKAHISMVV